MAMSAVRMKVVDAWLKRWPSRCRGTAPVLTRRQAEAAVTSAYQLILGRRPDAGGMEHSCARLGRGLMSVSDLCAELARSEELSERLDRAMAETVDRPPLPAPDQRADSSGDDPLIDPQEMVASLSVEELNRRADDYFRRVLDNPAHLLAKPYASPAEAPSLVITFGHLLAGLRLVGGMTVLDFGSGAGWTSRALAQMGCRVVAMDVSATALDLARGLFARCPPEGEFPDPQFVVFDGHRFDLADASVDRVVCFDAFHHVPNPAAMLGEMARVLKPGGRAGFSEPAEGHSRTPQSQYEMRNYGVIESDVVIDDVWSWARAAGFSDISMCVVDAESWWTSLQDFAGVLAGGPPMDRYTEHLRRSLDNRRMFVLGKQGTEVADSRGPAGLLARLEVHDVSVDPDGPELVVRGTCRARNTGTSSWLPSDAELGPVRLGGRVRVDGLTTVESIRVPLPTSESVPPGRSVPVPFEIRFRDPVGGSVVLELDLVSELVCWFSVNGGDVARIQVRQPGGGAQIT